MDDLFYILRVLSFKKLWFQALELIEAQTKVPIYQEHHYFNTVHLIYKEMREDDLAKLCYLNSLKRKEDYLISLNNLK